MHLSIDELNLQIARRQHWIEQIQDALPYADGGAYYQDKRRIEELHREIAELRSDIRVIQEGSR